MAEFHLDDDGHGDAEDVGVEESQETLNAAFKKLRDLKREDGVLVSLTKQDISLLKQMIHAPDTSDEFIKIALICDFLDDEEANRELDAFYEAIRLGMDTKYNIAHALSRAAINRRGSHSSSRVAMLLDTLSHQKFTSNAPKARGGTGGTSSRSPLA